MLPSQFFALDRYERAFIIGAIEHRTEQEKKKQKELERRSRARKGK